MRHKLTWFRQQNLPTRTTVTVLIVSAAAGPMAMLAFIAMTTALGATVPENPLTGFNTTSLPQNIIVASLIIMISSPLATALSITVLGCIKLGSIHPKTIPGPSNGSRQENNLTQTAHS